MLFRSFDALPDTAEAESAATELHKSDRDYWPTLDLEALNDQLAESFAQAEAQRGGPLIYPKWFVRRDVLPAGVDRLGRLFL